jgi:hypothetical protein
MTHAKQAKTENHTYQKAKQAEACCQTKGNKGNKGKGGQAQAGGNKTAKSIKASSA